MIAEGRSTPVIGFFPAEQAKIIRNWDVIGLRATGSHECHRRRGAGPDRPNNAADGGRVGPPTRSHRLPFFTLRFDPGGCFAGQRPAGVGRAGRAGPRPRSRFGRQQPLAEDPAFQADSPVCWPGSTRPAAICSTNSGLPGMRPYWDVTPAVAAGVSLATVETTAAALAAVQFAHQAAGTTSIRSQSTLARCLNDVLVATRHVAFSERRAERRRTFLERA